MACQHIGVIYCLNWLLFNFTSSNSFLAVVDALKTLQQKIRKLEVERMRAQKNYQDISQNIQPAATHDVGTAETEKCSRKGNEQPSYPLQESFFYGFIPSNFFNLLCLRITELDSKLQSAETRCNVLEKQLDYMKRMVDGVKKERISLMENKVFLEENTQYQ